MRYAGARFSTKIRESAYRNYVTDALYAIVNGGRFELMLTSRFAELFAPPKKPKEDTRTQEEIVDQVWAGIWRNKAVSE